MRVYAVISDQQTEFPVETLCRVCDVSRSAYCFLEASTRPSIPVSCRRRRVSARFLVTRTPALIQSASRAAQAHRRREAAVRVSSSSTSPMWAR